MPQIMIWVVLLAFFWEFVDASAGMGYGTAMSPILLLMDFSPLEIVPAILISNIGIGFLAAFWHHKFKNINFLARDDIEIMGLIAVSGLLAVIAAVWAAISLPQWVVIGYIAGLIVAVGIFMLVRKKWKGRYSPLRMVLLSFFAAFNKGVTGGGFGPVVVGGQMFSGVESRKAVGIASMAESLISLTGALAYFVASPQPLNWSLTFSLVLGSLIAVPMAAYFISRLPALKHRSFIGVTCIVVGLLTLFKFFTPS